MGIKNKLLALSTPAFCICFLLTMLYSLYTYTSTQASKNILPISNNSTPTATPAATSTTIPTTTTTQIVASTAVPTSTPTATPTASAIAPQTSTPAATPDTDGPFGIETHLENYDLKLAASIPPLGIRQIRADIRWSLVEKTKGQYDFSAYDAWMATAQKYSITPLVILDYSSPWYDNGHTPYDTAGYTAFANYAQAVLNHYGKQIKAVEVYNEYNEFSDGPCYRNVACYTQLLKYTYLAVKALRPDVTVVGGSFSDLALNWFEQMFKTNGLKYMDVISDHPYSNEQTRPPEAGPIDQQMLQLQQLIQKYNGGQTKPIWITELGWPTCCHRATEQTQADYLVRSAVLSLSVGVKKFFWYDLLNDGTNPTAKEDTFGLLKIPAVGSDYTPKPAYLAYTTLAYKLSSAAFIQSEAVGNNVYAKLFSNNLHILWTTLESQDLIISTPKPLTVTSMTGQEKTYQPSNGKILLTLTGDPIYIQANISSIRRQNITASKASAPADLNLSDEGTLDWATWNAYNAPNFQHKDTGISQISNYTIIKGANNQPASDDSNTDWNNQMPEIQEIDAVTGAFVAGVNNGFQFTVPANTNKRILRVYVNAQNAIGHLTASLSDGSGIFTDSTIVSTSSTPVASVYTLLYQATSDQQILSITWTTQQDFGNGGISLLAATLGATFITNLESDNPQPTWSDSVDSNGDPAGGIKNVQGICCGLLGPEMGVRNMSAHTENNTLLYSGLARDLTAPAYDYMKVFDLSGQNIMVSTETQLSYWIYPESTALSYGYATKNNSTCVAVDLIFSDKTTLRDSGALDQNGNGIHASTQCNHLTLDTWNQVIVKLGTYVTGKTINRLDIDYSQPLGIGGYRGYIDNISISN